MNPLLQSVNAESQSHPVANKWNDTLESLGQGQEKKLIRAPEPFAQAVAGKAANREFDKAYVDEILGEKFGNLPEIEAALMYGEEKVQKSHVNPFRVVDEKRILLDGTANVDKGNQAFFNPRFLGIQGNHDRIEAELYGDFEGRLKDKVKGELDKMRDKEVKEEEARCLEIAEEKVKLFNEDVKEKVGELLTRSGVRVGNFQGRSANSEYMWAQFLKATLTADFEWNDSARLYKAAYLQFYGEDYPVEDPVPNDIDKYIADVESRNPQGSTKVCSITEYEKVLGAWKISELSRIKDIHTDVLDVDSFLNNHPERPYLDFIKDTEEAFKNDLARREFREAVIPNSENALKIIEKYVADYNKRGNELGTHKGIMRGLKEFLNKVDLTIPATLLDFKLVMKYLKVQPYDFFPNHKLANMKSDGEIAVAIKHMDKLIESYFLGSRMISSRMANMDAFVSTTVAKFAVSELRNESIGKFLAELKQQNEFSELLPDPVDSPSKKMEQELYARNALVLELYGDLNLLEMRDLGFFSE